MGGEKAGNRSLFVVVDSGEVGGERCCLEGRMGKLEATEGAADEIDFSIFGLGDRGLSEDEGARLNPRNEVVGDRESEGGG